MDNKITPLSLSAAIRLGSLSGPQLTHMYTDHKGGTCARGAALLAVGRLAGIGQCSLNIEAEKSLWPWAIKVEPRTCPVDHCRGWVPGIPAYMFALIAHLNDDHRWSREKIADYVELHEPMEMLDEIPESGMEIWHAKSGLLIHE